MKTDVTIKSDLVMDMSLILHEDFLRRFRYLTAKYIPLYDPHIIKVGNIKPITKINIR